MTKQVVVAMNPVRALTLTIGYELDALEPVISRETVLYHLVQHHRDCYERTAALVRGTNLEALPLESLVRFAAQHPSLQDLCALASEAWSHDLYWQSLRPGGGGRPWGLIDEGIRQSFGTFAAFEQCTKVEARGLFGSGWLWVTFNRGRIEVMTTSPGESPVAGGHFPLLAIDLWEHAYYLDYYAGRTAYVAACLHELVDWGCANARLTDLAKHRDVVRSGLSWLACGASTTSYGQALQKTATTERLA